MKTLFALALIPMLLASCTERGAAPREAGPRYKFAAGTTNVYAVEISTRSEAGLDVMTGNVVLVTKEVNTNSIKLLCRGMLMVENTRASQGSPWMSPGHFPARPFYPFPMGCEIEINNHGLEIRDSGDYVLTVPLGKLVQSLFEPLPAKWSDEETTDQTTVLDEPFWLGPAASFLPTRMNEQTIAPMVRLNGYPQPTAAALTLSCQVSSHAKDSTNDTVEWHKQTNFRSLAMSGNEPRLIANCEFASMFDRTAGLLANIEKKADLTSVTETTVRKAKTIFKAHLLQGAALTAALAPPKTTYSPRVPSAPRKLNSADLDQICADLKSPNIETRRAAIHKLDWTEFEAPSAELVHLVGQIWLESDPGTRITAENFLGTYATSNEVDVLLKMVKASDYHSLATAAKALGRLKESRAAPALADWIARNGSVNTQEAIPALINIGTPAEKAVLALLTEHNADTRRIACNILQQIGTGETLDALQKLVGDSNESTSQAAAEAIRAIKLRQ